jgi:gliding motility-associated-like protein
MAIDCKQVYVVNVPPITLTPDTLICQGDTLRLVVASQFATDYYFSPDYNLSAPAGINVYVYPDRKFTYHIGIPFPDGCFVDTSITVDISAVKADAGPDRTIADGASTIIGGPNTYKGAQYSYEWFPTQFMDNPFSLNPTVAPSSDLTYYLKVTNTDGCYDIDTVNVKADCGNIYLPNAFAPGNERGGPTRFGILNKQIVQLNYFRIFDRWGREVFSTPDITKEWDGNVNGEPAPLGVYVWTADGFCRSGQRINRSGNVTLIR